MSEAHKIYKVVSNNKKAYHDYFIEDKYEAGISLVGTEVKSVKMGHINLKDAYADFKDGSVFLKGVHISPYEKGNLFNRDPLRDRRLLLHKKEILKLKQLLLTVSPSVPRPSTGSSVISRLRNSQSDTMYT